MSKDKDKVVTKNARSKLGKEKYDEIIEKDWKKAKIPVNYEKRRGRDGRKLNKKSLENYKELNIKSQQRCIIHFSRICFKRKWRNICNFVFDENIIYNVKIEFERLSSKKFVIHNIKVNDVSDCIK